MQKDTWAGLGEARMELDAGHTAGSWLSTLSLFFQVLSKEGLGSRWVWVLGS